MTTNFLNTAIRENKIIDQAEYITTQEFNKLTAEYFTAKLKQAKKVSKADFDNKLVRLNKKINSNKTKYL